jgi:hypothetical protein
MSASERPEHETGAEPEEKKEGERRHTGNLADEKHPVPLFLRNQRDGRQGNAQDEKDEAAE